MLHTRFCTRTPTDHLIAISGGGLIPARMLRTMLREDAGASGKRKGSVATIKVIGLELYNDDAEGQQVGCTRMCIREATPSPITPV